MHLFDAADRKYRYVIGIDLGTTNTAVAYVDLKQKKGRSRQRAIQFFEIPQLVAPGEFGHQPVLPSFLYVPGAYDLPEGSTALPWDAGRSYVVGEMAREQGAKVPGQLVASAKSWLCHESVDRTARILPWGAPEDAAKLSPVEASRRYIQHVREAWNAQVAEEAAQRFEEQLIILTVPASFDEVARELTVRAARNAGLPHIILLEEPLAAFYAWMSEHGAERDRMQAGELILVCDVGGGTTDFSIVGIREEDGDLRFERLAVGDHLMLGGDNMDNALGRKVEAEIAGGMGRLDARRWQQLVHQCRRAKEQLLDPEEAPEAVDVTVVGSGGKLIADTLTGRLTRDEVHTLILDGFLPKVEVDEPLHEQRRTGLTELGLPYEQDPAITRHLAAFWRRSQPFLREHIDRTHLYPDYVLFNGGVFTPDALRDRIKHIVQGWFGPEAGTDWAPVELTNPRLDRAVAMGAAYYGLVRMGEGVRVGSGSARAYYVGVESGEEAAKGKEHTAVCLVPRGAEEGFAGRLDDLAFEARANQPVTFHLFSSSTRSGDALGEVVRLKPDEAAVLPPIRTVLQFGRKNIVRRIPVELAVQLTEVGTLELWCQSRQTEHRWQLQFDVRQAPEPEAAEEIPEASFEPERLEAALEVVRAAFAEGSDRPEMNRVWHRLEKSLGMPRANWPMPVLRKLADALLQEDRTRSASHEGAWFELLGFFLRPGYGDPVDEWRMQQVWKLQLEGLRHANVDNRFAWWQFWRRVGGGLPAAKQEQMYYEARPYIQLQVNTRKDHRIYPRRMKMDEKLEAWMTLASFERLPVDIKVALGRLVMQSIKDGRALKSALWALSRLGARHPLYGPHDRIVPAEEVAAWIKTIISLPPPRRDYVAYALVQMARASGARDREVPEEWQQQVYRWLRKMPEEDLYRDLLANPEPSPDHPGQAWFVGEPIPEKAPALEDPLGIAYPVEEDGQSGAS